MTHSDSEAIQLYFNRIRPICHQLFNLAHAITGNCDQAEYCLQFAMLECWTAGEADASRHGFRERLRASIIRAALKTAARESAEFDWNGLSSLLEGDAISRMITQEPAEVRRMLVLRYGCGLPVRRIAQLMQADRPRIQQLLLRFEARMKRRLPPGERRRWEARVSRTVLAATNHPTPLAPEMGSILRTFQANAATTPRTGHLPAHIFRIVLAAVLALMCMLTFWLAAVLVQPAVLEEPGNTNGITEIAE